MCHEKFCMNGKLRNKLLSIVLHRFLHEKAAKAFVNCAMLLTLIRMTKDKKGLAFFKGLLLENVLSVKNKNKNI
jgi:hypothetical protein